MLCLHNDISVMERKDDYSEALAPRGKFGKCQALACCHFYSTSSRAHNVPDDDMENKRWGTRVVGDGFVFFS